MIHRSLILAAICMAASSVMAQVPPDIAAKNKEIGKKVDTVASAAIYGPLQKHEPYGVAGLQISRDIAYGPGAMEKLDLFTRGSAPGQALRPVLILVHGGGFVGGDKSPVTNGVRSPFYDNIMLWAVDHGMVGVNINYEVAPKATYPAVQKSLAAVVAWARTNALMHGGDPNRIFLMGHSAGASHVAAYLATPEFHPAGGVGVKGAILSSGALDAGISPNNPYFVPADRYGKLDFVPGLMASKLPLLVFYAEFDPDFASLSAQRFAKESVKAPVKPRILLNKDHGHMSESYSIGTADQSVSGPIEQFVKENR